MFQPLFYGYCKREGAGLSTARPVYTRSAGGRTYPSVALGPLTVNPERGAVFRVTGGAQRASDMRARARVCVPGSPHHHVLVCRQATGQGPSSQTPSRASGSPIGTTLQGTSGTPPRLSPGSAAPISAAAAPGPPPPARAKAKAAFPRVVTLQSSLSRFCRVAF